VAEDLVAVLNLLVWAQGSAPDVARCPRMKFPASLTDRYEPLEVLGEGGFGAVWKCRDLRMGRDLAIKLLTLESDDEAVQRFRREARVTAALRSPHVVEVYDHGVADGVPWIAYALLDGCDLDAWRRREGRPGDELLATWAIQGAHALAVVHEAGLVHRDVKPANVFVRAEDQSLVLVDFGISRAEHRPDGTLHTQEGMILGTPGYMAPELFRGLPPSAASDQWAWAAVIAELYTGEPPYGTCEPGEVVKASGSYRAADGMGPGHLGAVLRRALAANPARRFADSAAFAAALQGEGDVVRERATEVLSSTPGGDATLALTSPPATSPPGPKPWGRVLGGLGLLGVALGIGWSSAPSSAPTAPPPATTVEAVDVAEMTRLERAVEEAEVAVREQLAPAGSTQRWQWYELPLGDPRRRERPEGRALAADPEVTAAWFALTRALGAWLPALDRLPPNERATKLPALYRNHALPIFFGQLIGSDRSMAKVHLRNVDPSGSTGDVLQQERLDDDIEWQRQKRLRATLELADTLLEHPEASTDLRRAAWILRFYCRRDELAQDHAKVVELLPTDMPNQQLVLHLYHAIFDRPLLWGDGYCSETPTILRVLGEKVPDTVAPIWTCELSALGVIAWTGWAQRCPDIDRAVLVRQVRGLVDRARAARSRIQVTPGGLENKTTTFSYHVERLEPSGGPLHEELDRLREALPPGSFTP
jgi:hypothetical protein